MKGHRSFFRISLLGTSTAAFHVPGGRILPVPGLAVSEARALYLAAVPAAGVVLPEGELGSVGAVVDSLDGLPLALELAGLRAGTLPPSRWLAAGSERLALASDGSAGARHGSLAGVLERAWADCSAEERRALLGCRVFREPFTLDGAAAVAGVDEPVQHRLAQRPWLAASEVHGPKAFRLYDIVRQWLADRPIDEATLNAHARWSGERARALRGRIHGHGRPEAQREVFATARDLRAAGDRLVAGDPELGAQVALLFSESCWQVQQAKELAERLVEAPVRFPSLPGCGCSSRGGPSATSRRSSARCRWRSRPAWRRTTGSSDRSDASAARWP